MAETSIKISLELADKAAQKALSDFIDKGDSAEKKLNKVKDSGSETFSEIAVHIGKATGAYEIFTGNLAANLAVKAFELLTEAAHKLYETLVVEGIHAAQEQENALNGLNVALAQNGHYSAEVSKRIDEFADSIEAATGVEGHLILQNAALIEAMTGLGEKGLKQATAAAVDLSAALGIDLGSASTALAKAANGNVTALQKMGLEIRKGQNDSETFANALKAVEERFAGSAAGKVNTFSGALAQASAAFGKLQEESGNFIIKNPAIVAVLQESAKLFHDWTESVKQQGGAFQLIGQGMSVFLGVGAFVIQEVDLMVRIFQVLYGVVQAASLVFAPITVAVRALSVGFTQANAELQDFAKSTGKNLTALGQNGNGALKEISDGMLRLKDAADKGLASLATGATTSVEPLNNAKGKTAELTEEMKRAQERLKSFAEDLVKQGESAKAGADKQLEVLQAQADSEIALEQDKLNRKLITQVQFLEAKNAIDAEFEAERQAIQQSQFEADNQRLIDARAQNLITEKEYAAAKTQLATNFNATQEKLDADNLKQTVKNRKDLLDAEKNLEAQKVKAVGDTFGALSSLMQTSSRELFEIGKASAIAAATINTYEAITKTMASVPYPFNIPLAAAQGIAGFVQVANISKTSPSFEDGGIVPGTSYTGDRISANVNSGEMILNRSQQKTLFGLANGQGAGNGNGRVEALLTALLDSIQSQPIIVNVGGKTIVDTLRSELATGRTFA